MSVKSVAMSPVMIEFQCITPRRFVGTAVQRGNETKGIALGEKDRGVCKNARVISEETTGERQRRVWSNQSYVRS